MAPLFILGVLVLLVMYKEDSHYHPLNYAAIH